MERGLSLSKKSDGARASLPAELVEPTDLADWKRALLLEKEFLRIFPTVAASRAELRG
jgi:hypothetical protein